jgi:hypothetical protein
MGMRKSSPEKIGTVGKRKYVAAIATSLKKMSAAGKTAHVAAAKMALGRGK